MARKSKKTVVILSVSSDIGFDLAKRYHAAGWRVVGTYRSDAHLQGLRRLKDCHLFYCDVAHRESVREFVEQFRAAGFSWQVFISSVGMPQPLTAFFKTDFDEWSDSVHVNAIEQLRVLHALYPLRDKKEICDCVYFAGGGTNNAVVDFSAYTIAKIMLIKMCEFLDAENPDLNIFVVGPGWTRTKTHYKILNDPRVSRAKSRETAHFLKTKKGTPLRDIYGCIEWLRGQGKKIAGGRNFSVVHDLWKGTASDNLAAALKQDPNMYKLRRWGNDYRP